ncbi:hypothetical protein, partial [Effusibacillus pohliae]|uniref:hypothetical protein n=1 Tax=Effusibacillus pohliae TaxID=232270 RepID=UPI001B7FB244
AVNVNHSETQHTGGAFCFANRILIHHRNSSFSVYRVKDKKRMPTMQQESEIDEMFQLAALQI